MEGFGTYDVESGEYTPMAQVQQQPIEQQQQNYVPPLNLLTPQGQQQPVQTPYAQPIQGMGYLPYAQIGRAHV